ncbi:MAG: site-2 protease family protein, partial [Kiritimatiellaeota bacterium]|nr:site-2 protease family protein [Kiritimatiellota bacterium]
MNFFIVQAWEQPFFFFAWVGIVTFSICVHEFAHAWMALRCGDDTAARAGHLSLNPFRQMGPSSLIALLVVGIAWGAVPV